METGLRGGKVLITGATRGIGRAIAEAFAREGADVAFCARDAKAVKETQARLAALGVRVEARALDVADKNALRDFVHDTGRAFGGIDAVVANASGFADGADEPAFRVAFEVDLLHTVALAEAAKAILAKSRNASITAISSISASEDYRHGDAAYGAMKAAINFYIKSLATEIAPMQIRANCVSPGTTWFEGGFWHEAEKKDPQGFAAALKRNPMGRMVVPENIADAVVFLASERARFITGANLVVDGGYTRRVQN